MRDLIFVNFNISMKKLFQKFYNSFNTIQAWKSNNSNLSFFFINQLTKIIYYKQVKITINSISWEKFKIDVLLRHDNFFNFIISDRDLLFTSKFFLLLCYFLAIKLKLFIIFYSQTNCWIERKRSIIMIYFWVVVN